MSLTITNQASTVKFLLSNGDEYNIDKDNMNIKKKGRFVYVYSGNEEAKINNKLKFRYSEVSSPSFISNDELVTALIGYKANTGITIGDVRIVDGTGNAMTLEPNGSLPVTLQDQTTPTVITQFSILEETTTTTGAVAIDDYIIPVTDATGISAGKYLAIFDPTSVRFMNAFVVSVSVLNVTIDRPLDFAFPIGSYVDVSDTNLAKNGAVTPIVAGIRNNAGAVPPPGINLTMDVTRVLFHCVGTSAFDLTTFGDRVKLPNGFMMRRRDGVYYNIFNSKTNGELKGIMFDFDIVATGTVGQGEDGFFGRLTFGGQNKMGVVHRIALNEDLEIIIQDDLSSLTLLEVVAEGSIVQP
jgi:hypothetical protein